MASRLIGVAVKRTEDPRLLTGRGKYVADFRLSGMLHAAVLRSPHAHARLRKIDASAALALPDVTTVITARDLGPVGRIPVRLGPRPARIHEIVEVDLPRPRRLKVRQAPEFAHYTQKILDLFQAQGILHE